LKERLDGTVPTLPTRFVARARTPVWSWVAPSLELKHRNGGHTPGDMVVWLPQKSVLFAGDVVYVDRVLGLHPVSNTRNWLESLAVIDALKPQTIVPGHGNVTNLATAQAHTRDLLLALRAT
jgi:glyoxylase-like metal-dependent hydrolase (beta-lactamase superfamily II)